MRLVVLNGCVEAARARAEGMGAVTKVRNETYAFVSLEEWDTLYDDSGIAGIIPMDLSRIWEVGRGDRFDGGNTASLFIYGSPA